jgi:hypothetical protein
MSGPRDLTPGPWPDDRGRPDRRRRPTGPLDALRWGGRRAAVRRAEERQGTYFVDRSPRRLLALILLLMVLSLVDGLLTLRLVESGAEEVNPLLRALLDRGPQSFLMGKLTLTALGLPVLLVYRNQRLFGTRIRAGSTLHVFVVLFLVLLAYQVWLIRTSAGPY